MPGKRKREKVVAEITVSHLLQIARESGRSLTQEQALNFLNQNGCAYAMWTAMMRAGEAYVQTTLRQQIPLRVSALEHRRLAV